MLDTILNMFVTCIRAMIGALALVLACNCCIYMCVVLFRRWGGSQCC